jgi:hypothetical protein
MSYEVARGHPNWIWGGSPAIPMAWGWWPATQRWLNKAFFFFKKKKLIKHDIIRWLGFILLICSIYAEVATFHWWAQKSHFVQPPHINYSLHDIHFFFFGNTLIQNYLNKPKK